MNDLEKHKVHDALRATLEAELSILDAMVTAARDEATSAESRPENKYDTRALEASYLAAGQGERLATLRQLVAWARGLDAAPQSAALPGALLHIQTDAGTRWLVLAPTGVCRRAVFIFDFHSTVHETDATGNGRREEGYLAT